MVERSKLMKFQGDKGGRKVRVAEISDKVDPNAFKSKPYYYVDRDGKGQEGVKNVYRVEKKKLEETIMPSGRTAKEARKQTIKKNIFDGAMGTGMAALSTLFGASMMSHGKP